MITEKEIAERFEETAEQAGEAAENSVAAVAEEIQETVEIATERAEKAEEIAAAITEGAMENERAVRVSKLEERFDQWQNQLTTEKVELEQKLEAMETRLAERINSSQSSLIPPILTTPAPEAEAVEVIAETPPENAEGPKEAEIQALEEKPEDRKRRKRWM